MRHLILILLTIGCTSALPVEQCTPAKQSAFLANCSLAVELCNEHSELCPDPAVCKEDLERLCPADR